jgi:hypothetical protein
MSEATIVCASARVAPPRATRSMGSLDAPQCSKKEAPVALEKDHDVEEVVRLLNGMCKAATLAFTISVGSLIINKLYAGSCRAWHHRGPKTLSFRRLARHPDLPMSAGSLYRCVAIYEMCQRLALENYKHVSTSHLRLILPLKDDDQARLVNDIELHRWPVQRLREHLESLSLPRSPRSRGGGRKPRSNLRRAQQILSKCAGLFEELAKLQNDSMTPLSLGIEEAVALLSQTCAAMKDRLDACVEPQSSPVEATS